MMKTLSESMNMQVGQIEDAYIFKINPNINYYETLCLICAEKNINTENLEDSDFDSCAMILEDYCKGIAVEGEKIVSIWFD